MASLGRGSPDDIRRAALSPRPKGREAAKDTLCRNVTIYGHCRYENKGCAFNHDPVKAQTTPENMKKRFNVESPSFTPTQSHATLAVNGATSKPLGLSPKAASAAPFKPKGFNGGSGNDVSGLAQRKQYNPAAPDWPVAPSPDIVDYMSQPQGLPQNISTAMANSWKVSEHPLQSRPENDIDNFSLDCGSNRLSAASPGVPFVPTPPRRRTRFSDNTRPMPPVPAAPPANLPFPPPHPYFPPLDLSFTNWNLSDVQIQMQADTNSGLQSTMFDPYGQATTPLPNPSHSHHPAQVNPYTQDPGANTATSYFQGNTFTQPLQYHLYAPLGPHREKLHAHQRLAGDFFISDELREELQRKSAAAWQSFPNNWLPQAVDHFHSLVPLDKTDVKNATLFGYPSWIYKVMSSKDGHYYALRRLEGYRLTNEKAIRSLSSWKRIDNANVVTIHNAFTTTTFGDSSLIFVTDFHPLSKTLAEVHFSASRYGNRVQGPHVAEQTLWGYIAQIFNALVAIHRAKLSARLIDASKVIVTDENRIRLNACGILDVVQHETARSLKELQDDDFVQAGRMIVALGTNTPKVMQNFGTALEQFSRFYSKDLRDRVMQLLNPTVRNNSGFPGTIGDFLTYIGPQLMDTFDASEHLNDRLMSELNKELENARLVRLMFKIMAITERPEYSGEVQWSEVGERYPIKLFRDYVFHQVSASGAPVMDMGHMIACLNKLDVGSEERMTLTSRDEEHVLYPTYKEIKRLIDSAYGDLQRLSRQG